MNHEMMAPVRKIGTATKLSAVSAALSWVLAAAMPFLAGCEDDEESGGSSLTDAATAVFEGSGASQAAEYTADAIPHQIYVAGKLSTGAIADHSYYLTGAGAPSGWFATKTSDMQLVLTIDSVDSIPDGTRGYSIGGVNYGVRTVELRHKVAHLSLKIATTAEVIATTTVNGNRIYPNEVAMGTSTVSDQLNFGPLVNWLRPYIEQ